MMGRVKRREPLNLAHVLEDRRLPAVPISTREKRIHTRFDKAFLVMIGSELYGDTFAIARNISAGGILVEMTYAPPLGTVVTVHFQRTRDEVTGEVGGGSARPRGEPEIEELVVRAEVKHHHYLNFTGGDDAASARAIGLRFLEFVDLDEHVPPERWH
jgi:hypothetical protein